MKKCAWLIGIALVIAILGFMPSAGMDVGKLQPVQVVAVQMVNEQILVQTDTADEGTGDTLMEAVENLKQSTGAEVFLDTAEHLLIAPDCAMVMEDVLQLFRPSCTLCWLDGEANLQGAAEFLNYHVPKTTLMEYRAGNQMLQTLRIVNGRMRLVS